MKDGGKNFGRIARVEGLLEQYTAALLQQPIAGIPADHWTLFLRKHAETNDPAKTLEHLTQNLEDDGLDAEVAAEVADAIAAIVDRLK